MAEEDEQPDRADDREELLAFGPDDVRQLALEKLDDALEQALELAGDDGAAPGGQPEEQHHEGGHNQHHDHVVGDAVGGIGDLDAEQLEGGGDGAAEDPVEQDDDAQSVLELFHGYGFMAFMRTRATAASAPMTGMTAEKPAANATSFLGKSRIIRKKAPKINRKRRA